MPVERIWEENSTRKIYEERSKIIWRDNIREDVNTLGVQECE